MTKDIEIGFREDPEAERIRIDVVGPERSEEVETLLDRIGLAVRQAGTTLTVFDGEGAVRTLAAEEIVSTSVMGKLVSVSTETGTYYVKTPLQTLERMLDDRGFLRISRFELVNLRKVVRYEFGLRGLLRIDLANGTSTWASRRNISVIRKILSEKE